MPLILTYVYIVFVLGAVSAIAQIIVSVYKALPAFFLTLLTAIIAIVGALLFIAVFPVSCPYAIYKAKGKWSKSARIFVSILYVVIMLFVVGITYYHHV